MDITLKIILSCALVMVACSGWAAFRSDDPSLSDTEKKVVVVTFLSALAVAFVSTLVVVWSS